MRLDGPAKCHACGAPIAMVATLDVDGSLWVAPRFEAFLWVSVDAQGRAVFRCGPCAPHAYPVLATDDDGASS